MMIMILILIIIMNNHNNEKNVFCRTARMHCLGAKRTQTNNVVCASGVFGSIPPMSLITNGGSCRNWLLLEAALIRHAG